MSVNTGRTMRQLLFHRLRTHEFDRMLSNYIVKQVTKQDWTVKKALPHCLF